jgi:DNA repair ATPase RecN
MAMISASPLFSPETSPRNVNSQSDMMSIILQRLDSMDKKLSHLETIQSSVNSLTVKSDTMSKQINVIESKIQDIENSRAFDSSLLDSINKRQDELEKMIQSMKKSEQKSSEDDLKAEIIDLKCRSMRDNLIFYL